MGINGVKGIGDMKIAEIRNLSYSYRENCGQKKAVLNVSFDIDEGGVPWLDWRERQW